MFNNVTVLNGNGPALEDLATSPFAVYPGETITQEKKAISPITPTDLDKAILSIVCKTLFCTSALILLQLERTNVPHDISNVKNRIVRMCESQFLMGYRFKTSTGGRSSHLAYRLGWRGVGFLRANGIQPRLGAYLASISEDATLTKKILSSVQFVLRTNLPLETVSFCQAVLVPSKDPNKKTTRIFRPQAVIQLPKGTVFIESVRQDSDWESSFHEKLNRIESVLRSHQTNIPVSNPSIILIAENAVHMQMLLHMIDKRGSLCPVYFTADTLVYSSPDHCLYQLPKRKNLWQCLFAL